MTGLTTGGGGGGIDILQDFTFTSQAGIVKPLSPISSSFLFTVLMCSFLYPSLLSLGRIWLFLYPSLLSLGRIWLFLYPSLLHVCISREGLVVWLFLYPSLLHVSLGRIWLFLYPSLLSLGRILLFLYPSLLSLERIWLCLYPSLLHVSLRENLVVSVSFSLMFWQDFLFPYLSAGFVRSSFLLSYLWGKILPEGVAADGVAG